MKWRATRSPPTATVARALASFGTPIGRPSVRHPSRPRLRRDAEELAKTSEARKRVEDRASSVQARGRAHRATRRRRRSQELGRGDDLSAAEDQRDETPTRALAQAAPPQNEARHATCSEALVDSTAARRRAGAQRALGGARRRSRAAAASPRVDAVNEGGRWAADPRRPRRRAKKKDGEPRRRRTRARRHHRHGARHEPRRRAAEPRTSVPACTALLTQTTRCRLPRADADGRATARLTTRWPWPSCGSAPLAPRRGAMKDADAPRHRLSEEDRPARDVPASTGCSSARSASRRRGLRSCARPLAIFPEDGERDAASRRIRARDERRARCSRRSRC